MDELRDISVGEFFARNKQLLGFNSPKRAILTTVKEAVDNSLDACEEAEILPEISVMIESVEDSVVRVTVSDNGPGIPYEHAPAVFGKLLFGSRFHKFAQSRGQQGIGISAAVLYAMLTTGEATEILVKTRESDKANKWKLYLNISNNTPKILSTEEFKWDRESGVQVSLVLKAQLTSGPWSVREYLQQTSLVNPHATIKYKSPEEEIVLERTSDELPHRPKAINPHPHGLDFGLFSEACKDYPGSVGDFLAGSLSGISTSNINKLCKALGRIKTKEIAKLAIAQPTIVKQMYDELQGMKLQPPDLDCISPIGEIGMLLGLPRLLKSDYVVVDSRPPAIYSGTPFLVETGLIHAPGEQNRLYRFANKVPLLYKSGACVITDAAKEVNWKAYQLSQTKATLPENVILFAHVASPYVPFESESKEAIADYPEILNELKLSFQACGRDLKKHLDKLAKVRAAKERMDYTKKFAPHCATAIGQILDMSAKNIKKLETEIINLLEKKREP